MQKARWAGHSDDWPIGFRPCTKCNEMKPFGEFHKHGNCLFGVNTVCVVCRKVSSKKQYKNSSIQNRIWNSARSRAKIKNIDFDLELSDIKIPKLCPVLGKPMSYNSDYSPSLDRKDPNKGYVKGNICVISKRANMLKNNATSEEMAKILEYILDCELI